MGRIAAPEAHINRAHGSSVTHETGCFQALPEATAINPNSQVLVSAGAFGSAGPIHHRGHSITAYDAAYVVLAEILDCPLITCDAKLARSQGHKARIELID